MKRIALGTLVLLLTAVGTCHAFVWVNVNSVGAYVHFGQAAGWPNAIGSGSEFHVVWSSDNDIEPTALGSHLPSGDDKLCTVSGGGDAVFHTGDNGGSWADFGKIENFDPVAIYAPTGVDPGTFNGGKLYLRVFNTNNPTVGDHYVDGSLNGIDDTNVWGTAWDTKGDNQLTPEDETPPIEPINPNVYEEMDMTASSDAVDVGGAGFIVLDSTIQAIPEPGTLGLLALGLAGVFAARRKRK